VREWQYWTRNKLDILAGYLPAFNTASMGKASERLYIDLMAGQPGNRDKTSGQEFDGSARLALQSEPGFTRHAFCEEASRAGVLESDLRTRFPHKDFAVYGGDCNRTIDQVLSDLSDWRWAPTFAFIDQQAAEVTWTTLAKVSAFRKGQRKTELWVLASPAMIAKGVAGTNGAEFATRVDKLYGNRDWRKIQAARDDRRISPAQYRDDMVDLLRWQLQNEMGYAQTERIPMRMTQGTPIYDMVFATDHPVGVSIMTHLYRRAAEREPRMIAEAKTVRSKRRDERAGLMSLFEQEPEPDYRDLKVVGWEHTEVRDPRQSDWW
jgi:three-Cys-motif partner protein